MSNGTFTADLELAIKIQSELAKWYLVAHILVGTENTEGPEPPWAVKGRLNSQTSVPYKRMTGKRQNSGIPAESSGVWVWFCHFLPHREGGVTPPSEM